MTETWKLLIPLAIKFLGWLLNSAISSKEVHDAYAKFVQAQRKSVSKEVKDDSDRQNKELDAEQGRLIIAGNPFYLCFIGPFAVRPTPRTKERHKSRTELHSKR